MNKKWLKVGFVATTLATVVAFWSLSTIVYLQAGNEGLTGCVGTVGVVQIHGYLSITDDYEEYQLAADQIINQINQYSSDPNVEVILLDIHSPGGSMTAGDEIAQAIRESEKKTVAVIREGGQSAAYLIASAADEVYAGKYSMVGNIGINGSYLSMAEKNRREGIEYVEIVSGQYKDIRNPDRPISQTEKALIQADVDAHHQMFVESVAQHREMDIAKVAELADGTTYRAEQALEVGLIDHVGTKEDALKDLMKSGTEVFVCP